MVGMDRRRERVRGGGRKAGARDNGGGVKGSSRACEAAAADAGAAANEWLLGRQGTLRVERGGRKGEWGGLWGKPGTLDRRRSSKGSTRARIPP